MTPNTALRELGRLASPWLTEAAAVYVSGFRFELQASAGAPPILVYQMGKVGSSSVYESLVHTRIRNPVYHVHGLSENAIKNVTFKHAARKKSGHSSQVIQGRMLAKKYSSPNRPRWKIITLVRDPIRTFLSHVFFEPQVHRPFLLNNDGTVNLDRAAPYVYETLAALDEDKSYIFSWFDKEFRITTGIDVFKHPFDPTSGYSVISGPKDDLLVLRLENLKEALSPALRGLMGWNLEVPRWNTNMNKGTEAGDSYRRFLDTLQIPQDILERVYATRLARHFYSATERSAAVQFWSRKK